MQATASTAQDIQTTPEGQGVRCFRKQLQPSETSSVGVLRPIDPANGPLPGAAHPFDSGPIRGPPALADHPLQCSDEGSLDPNLGQRLDEYVYLI